MHYNKIDVDVKKLKKLYYDNWRVVDIANELYISTRTMYRLIKKHNLKRGNIRKIHFNKKQLEEMIIENRNNYADMAMYLGVSIQTVVRRCKEYGIYKPNVVNEQEIYNMYYKCNLSMRNIAVILRVSTRTIITIFKKNNWKARDSKETFKLMINEQYKNYK